MLVNQGLNRRAQLSVLWTVEHVEADADRTVIERLDPRLGMVLAERYRLLHKIAAGGFGAVYVASDLVSNHDVAVKLLHPALAADENVAARFRREVEALTSLKSPHTVAALDAGEAPDGTPYLVMERLLALQVEGPDAVGARRRDRARRV